MRISLPTLYVFFNPYMSPSSYVPFRVTHSKCPPLYVILALHLFPCIPIYMIFFVCILFRICLTPCIPLRVSHSVYPTPCIPPRHCLTLCPSQFVCLLFHESVIPCASHPSICVCISLLVCPAPCSSRSVAVSLYVSSTIPGFIYISQINTKSGIRGVTHKK